MYTIQLFCNKYIIWLDKIKIQTKFINNMHYSYINVFVLQRGRVYAKLMSILFISSKI